MRAIQITGFGPPEVLTLATVPDPTPAPGEVRVRSHAIGVNFSDTERRRAVFDPPELPWIPGREAAGVIDVVGEGVDPALAGARVAYYSRRRGGAYAELATVAVDELLHFPDSVPFATMAAVPVQGLTAWGLVHFVANVRPGDVVLLHAAAGGVGQPRSSSPGGPAPVSWRRVDRREGRDRVPPRRRATPLRRRPRRARARRDRRTRRRRRPRLRRPRDPRREPGRRRRVRPGHLLRRREWPDAADRCRGSLRALDAGRRLQSSPRRRPCAMGRGQTCPRRGGRVRSALDRRLSHPASRRGSAGPPRARIAGIIREDRAAADHFFRMNLTFLPGLSPCASTCRRMSSCSSHGLSWEGACDLAFRCVPRATRAADEAALRGSTGGAGHDHHGLAWSLGRLPPVKMEGPV